MGFHDLHLGVKGGDIGDTALRVGRRAGRVELNAMYKFTLGRSYEFFR